MTSFKEKKRKRKYNSENIWSLLGAIKPGSKTHWLKDIKAQECRTR